MKLNLFNSKSLVLHFSVIILIFFIFLQKTIFACTHFFFSTYISFIIKKTKKNSKLLFVSHFLFFYFCLINSGRKLNKIELKKNFFLFLNCSDKLWKRKFWLNSQILFLNLQIVYFWYTSNKGIIFLFLNSKIFLRNELFIFFLT